VVTNVFQGQFGIFGTGTSTHSPRQTFARRCSRRSTPNMLMLWMMTAAIMKANIFQCQFRILGGTSTHSSGQTFAGRGSSGRTADALRMMTTGIHHVMMMTAGTHEDASTFPSTQRQECSSTGLRIIALQVIILIVRTTAVTRGGRACRIASRQGRWLPR